MRFRRKKDKAADIVRALLAERDDRMSVGEKMVLESWDVTHNIDGRIQISLSFIPGYQDKRVYNPDVWGETNE